MDLLSPDAINRDKQESTEQSQRRSQAIAAEESRLTKAINLAKQRAAEQINTIEADWQEYRKEKEKERNTLSLEIASLRNDRAELLKPIDEIKANASRILRDAETRAADVENQAKDLETNKEKNQEFAEALADRKSELDSRERKLDKREAATADGEARLKVSTETLSENWVEYHKAVHTFNAKILKLDQRAAQIKSKDIAQNYRHEQQNKWDKELDKKQRLIVNNYEALKRAQNQILGKE